MRLLIIILSLVIFCSCNRHVNTGKSSHKSQYDSTGTSVDTSREKTKETTVTVTNYGDTLTDGFEVAPGETDHTDSTESSGIKVITRVKKDSTGKTKVTTTAIAKPKTITQTATKETEKQKGTSATATIHKKDQGSEKTKEVQTQSMWGKWIFWIVFLLFIFGLIIYLWRKYLM
jgi:ATP-dependent Zn protease